MKYTLFAFGSSFSLKEKRLCFDAENPDVAERVSNAGRWVSRNLTNLAGETAVGLGKIVVSIPNGIFQGIEKTWEDNADARKDALAFLRKAGEFFSFLPFVGGSIENYFKGLTAQEQYEKLKQIIDTANWIPLFADVTVRGEILKGSVSDGTVKKNTKPGQQEVLKFLQTCNLETRRMIFMQHIDYALEKKSQVEAVGNEIVTTGTAEQRLKFLEDNTDPNNVQYLDTFANAMTAVYGETLPPAGSPAHALATSSLQEYYKDPVEGKSKVKADDHAEALRLKGPKASTAFLDNSVDSFKKITPLSKFKGALNLGVIGDTDLKTLGETYQKFSHEHSLTVSDAAKEIDKLHGESSVRLEKEGRTFMDSFQNMSGIEKLVLVGAAIYLLKSNKFFRNLGITAVAVYFGLKFFNKDENPGETMSKKIQQGVDYVKGKGKTALGIGEGPMDSKTTDAAKRAEVVSKFLPKKEGAEMKNQIIGLALLAETPLSLLATSFTMNPATSDGMRPWQLDVKPGSDLDKHLAQVMKDHGWKTDYRQFLEDYSHVIADAVGYSFYTLALKNKTPEIAALHEDVKAAKPKLASGESEIDFAKHQGDEDPNHVLFRAGEASYTMIVQQGRAMALNNNKVTLGDFMLAEVGSDGDTGKEKKENLNEKVTQKLSEIRKLSTPDYAKGFEATLKTSNTVHFGLNLTQEEFVAQAAVKDFLALDAKTILKKYDEWKLKSAEERAKNKNAL